MFAMALTWLEASVWFLETGGYHATVPLDLHGSPAGQSFGDQVEAGRGSDSSISAPRGLAPNFESEDVEENKARTSQAGSETRVQAREKEWGHRLERGPQAPRPGWRLDSSWSFSTRKDLMKSMKSLRSRQDLRSVTGRVVNAFLWGRGRRSALRGPLSGHLDPTPFWIPGASTVGEAPLPLAPQALHRVTDIPQILVSARLWRWSQVEEEDEPGSVSLGGGPSPFTHLLALAPWASRCGSAHWHTSSGAMSPKPAGLGRMLRKAGGSRRLSPKTKRMC